MNIEKSVSLKLEFNLDEIATTPAETGIMENIAIGAEIQCYAYLAGYTQLIKVSERDGDTLFLIGMPPNMGITYDSPRTKITLKKLSVSRFEMLVTYSSSEKFKE